MFGKHNRIANKRNRTSREHNVPENNHEALANDQEPVDQWQEAMADVPSFDEHLAEVSAEEEKQPLDLESLKDIKGFSEQLEKMGANQEIISNPAFQRILEHILLDSGLGKGVELEKTHKETENNLGFACQRDKNVYGNPNEQHDRSRFDIDVFRDGNFTIDYAYIDRYEKDIDSEKFPNFETPLNTVRSFDDNNFAQQLKFVKQKQADGFNVNILECYENEIAPVVNNPRLDVGLYHKKLIETAQGFNKEGQETSRVVREYAPYDADRLNPLSKLVGTSSQFGDYSPETATLNGLRGATTDYLSSQKVETFYVYSRNPDGDTMKIEGHDRNGKFGSDSVPLDTRYDDFVPTKDIYFDDLRSSSAE